MPAPAISASTSASPNSRVETVRRSMAENDLKPWRRDMWCIHRIDGNYVARMENVLDGHPRPAAPRGAEGVEHIIHAGDIGSAEIVPRLEEIATITSLFWRPTETEVAKRPRFALRRSLRGSSGPKFPALGRQALELLWLSPER